MSWIETFTFVMRSNATALRQKVQDPEKMVYQLIIDMDEELERVRHNVANAIADEILLRKKVERAREETEQWSERARAAMERSYEAGARAALDRKLLAGDRADGLEAEYRKQKSQVQKLQDAVGDLEDKIRQARQKQTLLLARLTRASSQQRINNALRDSCRHSAFTHFRELEDRVEREEAMSEAHDRLDGIDPEAEALEREFAESERQARLEKEYAALKDRLFGDTGSE